jgi:hypothetical protein
MQHPRSKAPRHRPSTVCRNHRALACGNASSTFAVRVATSQRVIQIKIAAPSIRYYAQTARLTGRLPRCRSPSSSRSYDVEAEQVANCLDRFCTAAGAHQQSLMPSSASAVYAFPLHPSRRNRAHRPCRRPVAGWRIDRREGAARHRGRLCGLLLPHCCPWATSWPIREL